MTSKIKSHHLCLINFCTKDKKKSSSVMIQIDNTITDILQKLNINIKDKKIFSYFENQDFPSKLKPCNLDVPIVKIFFDKGVITRYKNEEEFWLYQQFAKYSIHIFNYDYLNTTNSVSDKK